MVGNAYLDILVIENESLRAVGAFRMDENGDKKASTWSKQTRNLVMAAESAKFPLFIVPNTKEYRAVVIKAHLKKIIPVSKQHLNAQTLHDFEEKAKDKNDAWKRGGLK